VLLLLAQIISPAGMAQSALTPAQVTKLTLAGVQVEIELPFSTMDFIQAEPDDAQQVATSTNWQPFFEVSLAVNQRPESETANTAGLKSLRAEQAGMALPAHWLRFFDSPAASNSNQVELELRPTSQEAVVIHEWVTQVDDLTWTFRVSYTPGQAFDAALLDQIIIRRIGPALTLPNSPAAQVETPRIQSAADFAAPSWWHGDCDTDYYIKYSGVNARALGGSFRGVKACGPRPYFDHVKDVTVQFFKGAWGEYEWECVELSMRYLYLAYGIAPYHANGKDVVANYSGTRLFKISNGAIGQAPRPGDILSYGPTTTYGHTSLVSASSVNASGNGTVTVIEQNSTATGIQTLTVSNWVVQASMTVSGWLHEVDRTVELTNRIYVPLVVSQ
jgi:hypothetical protein